MLKVSCINCGNKYQVKDELAGKTLKCPQCGMAIHAAEQGKGEVNQDAVRAEILRLAGAKPDQKRAAGAPAKVAATAAAGAKEAAPKKRRRRKPAAAKAAAEPEPEEDHEPQARVTTTRRDYTGMIVGVFLLMLVGLGGFLGWMRYKAHQRDLSLARNQAATDIKREYNEVVALDPTCREQDAIDAWEGLRKRASDFEQNYGTGTFLETMTEAGRKIQDLQAALDSRATGVDKMKKLLVQGERKLERNDYAGAKKDLEGAVTLVAEQRCPDEAVKQVSEKARELLATDAVIYGSRGWVFHEEKWMSKQDRDKQTELAKAAEMEAKGFIKFEDKWITAEDKAKIILAREKKRREVLWRTAQQQKVLEQVAEGVQEVVVDPGTERLRWMGESWANPVKVAIEEHGEKKEKFVAAHLEGGDKDKWVVSIPQRVDLEGYDKLKIYLCASAPTKVALGVWTMPGFELFESPAQFVPKGCKDVTFDLAAANFKCRESNWRHSATLKNTAAAYKFSLFAYTHANVTLHLKNLRIAGRKVIPEPEEGEGEGAQKPAPKPEAGGVPGVLKKLVPAKQPAKPAEP